MTKKKTTTRKKKIDIAALVRETLAANPGARHHCPFFELDGEAKEFMDAMILAENEGNRKVNRKKVRSVLREVFNLPVGEDSVRKHLRKECATCNAKANQ